MRDAFLVRDASAGDALKAARSSAFVWARSRPATALAPSEMKLACRGTRPVDRQVPGDAEKCTVFRGVDRESAGGERYAERMSHKDASRCAAAATSRANENFRRSREGTQEGIRQFGKADIPREVFIAALKVDS